MDWVTLTIQAVGGALGANISGKLTHPQEFDGGLLNTVLGVVAGVPTGHYLGRIVGEAMQNYTMGHILTSAISGFLLVMIVKKFRYRKIETL
jgi:uncharacterized membrane protein YeaQ/YmgE (transglycosylase-associated protein family)